MFYNTGILVKLTLRRERIVSCVWIILTAGFAAFLAIGLYAAMDEASRLEMLLVLENPAMIAMIGPIIGMDNFTHGAMYTTFMLIFTAIAVVVMNIMLVVRHTRADEEKGRYEVVRSLPIGRLAHLNATIIVAVIVNIILAIITGLLLFAAGDESMGFNGSMLWGALLGSVGLFFAATAAVFAQLSSSSKGAMGYSLFVMGFFYLMRAVGDVSMEALSFISPLGLILRAQAYVNNNWMPVFVLIGLSIVIIIIAFRLNITRDIDQGLLPDKRGSANGGILLKSPIGFALKLSKTGLIVGFITMFVMAASYGTIMGDIEGFIETNEFYSQLILWMDGISMPLLFVGMINFMMAMLALIPMILYVTRVRSEEKDIRAELILAASVSKYKYLGGFAVISFVSSIILQLLTALGLWVSAQGVLEDISEFPLDTVIIGNLLYLPALWVIIGLLIFLIGVFPKAAGIIWAVYGGIFLLGLFGRMDIFPSWIINISPFAYIAQYPMENINWFNMVLLTIIAAVLSIIGFIGFRKRDIGKN